MKLIITSICMLLTFFSHAQASKNNATIVELTKVDITKLKNFDGNNTSFFGLKKGMSKAEAIKMLKTLPQFKWYFDAYNTKSEDENSTEQMRIYVSLLVKNAEGDYPSVLYLLWEKDKPQMVSMVIYKDAEQFCIGNTKKLFTTEAIDPNATFNKFLKGKALLDDGKFTTSYVYPSQHFAFISYVDIKNEKQIWIRFADK